MHGCCDRIWGMVVKKTILVVDDELDVITYLCTLFEDNGYATLRAVNGIEALEMAKSRRPDLITLDMTMPEQSGVRTLRDLKSDPDLAKIPVIIVTGIGESMNSFIQKMPRFPRPEGFIAKPIQREDLVGIVARLLG
jgi:two-component system phosphate regulon response regulator PhoB